MATIVFGGALSHSPLMNVTLQGDHDLVQRFQAGVAELASRLSDAEPDVLVVFGPDHFRALFYDLMPAFVVGVGRLDGWGDWQSPAGPFSTRGDLATHVLTDVMAHGFEPAFSYDLKVDHGVTQPLQLLGAEQMPVVPILINAAGPPLPTPARCHQFGAAVASAIARFPAALRVAVIGSGGLSHDPPAPSPESDDPAMVERAVHGRTTGFAASKARETGLLGRTAALAERINPEWDRMVLDRFARGQAAELAAELTTEGIHAAAGNGGQEIRTWLAVSGALGDPAMDVLSYDPIPALVTGMGIVAWTPA
ncbi:MAG: hypothetical protein KGN76_17210 [Acidobacteriota bacterium]|nr:hypothetical protein [Acidobacteriota bacterium]